MTQAPLTGVNPLRKGDVRLQALGSWRPTSVSGPETVADPDETLTGSAGLIDTYVPVLQLGGALRVGIADFIEIGAAVAVSSLEWAAPLQTPAVRAPSSEQAQQWVVGTGLRLNKRLPRVPLTLSVHAGLAITDIWQVDYKCTNCSDGSLTADALWFVLTKGKQTSAPDVDDPPPKVRVHAMSNEYIAVFNGGIGLSGQLSEHFAVGGVLAMTETPYNFPGGTTDVMTAMRVLFAVGLTGRLDIWTADIRGVYAVGPQGDASTGPVIDFRLGITL